MISRGNAKQKVTAFGRRIGNEWMRKPYTTHSKSPTFRLISIVSEISRTDFVRKECNAWGR